MRECIVTNGAVHAVYEYIVTNGAVHAVYEYNYTNDAVHELHRALWSASLTRNVTSGCVSPRATATAEWKSR